MLRKAYFIYTFIGTGCLKPSEGESLMNSTKFCIAMACVALSLGSYHFVQSAVELPPVKSAQPAAATSVNSMVKQAGERLHDAAQHHESWVVFLMLCFFAGFLTSLLPCIYPMIPITVSILQAQQSTSLGHNFLLSLFYVLGISSMYAVLGYACSTTSLLFGSWFASPWFLLFIIAFFIYLALSMLGFYELYIPRFLLQSPKLEARGSLLRSFFLGIVSATVASPCMAPPLAILITLVAQQGNPLFGLVAFFAFSFGMSFLLLLVGTFSGALSLLPQSGVWLEEMKHLLGFVLLGVCVFLLKDVIKLAWILGLYGVIFFLAAWYYGVVMQRSDFDKKNRWATRLLMVVFVGCLLAGFGLVGAMIKIL